MTTYLPADDRYRCQPIDRRAVAETGMTVVLSSHIVADLERVCDHLVILSRAETQLVGEIDEIVASHRLLAVFYALLTVTVA